MKKVVPCLLFVGLIMTGCSNNEESTTPPTDTTSQTTSVSEEQKADFEYGKIITDEFELTYKNSEIVKSPSEDGYGLYITYSLKNTSDNNITPIDIINDYVLFKQENETSEVDLDNTYYSLDAFGSTDDVESYNEQVDKENFRSDELLPDKTVDIIETYSLDNLDFPVKMIAMYEDKEIGIYEIDLTELEKPEETKSLDNTNNPNEDSSYNEGLSDMPASWQEGEAEWEKAKAEGWTVEDWEEAVRASENETYVVGSGQYEDSFNGSQAEQTTLPEGTSENARRIYNEIKSIQDRALTSGEIQTLEAIEQGYYE